MPTEEAKEIARSRGLDLVEISPNVKPPVCKIIDYGKFKYEQSKKARQAKKKQHVTHLKEIKLSPSIEEHDINFKLKNAEKFLKKHDKVKFTVKFKGREMKHMELGYELLDKIREEFEDIATMEKNPQRLGKTLSMILGPVSKRKKGGS